MPDEASIYIPTHVFRNGNTLVKHSMGTNMKATTRRGDSNFSAEKYSSLMLSIQPVQRAVPAFNYRIYRACLTCIVLTDNRDQQEKRPFVERRKILQT
jgi:hypothetical protein